MTSEVVRSQDRLYQDLARSLRNDLTAGLYPIGARLPAERELATKYNVSRPTVREAIIALEVQGLIEVRIGSGAYVCRLPGSDDLAGFNISAFEITEARLLIEGEAAALAATQARDEDLADIGRLVEEIARENITPGGTEQADRAFHIAIAKASRNGAIVEAINRLWDLRAASPEASLLHAKARSANIQPVVAEHAAILQALQYQSPEAARSAMRDHLSQVLESLLFATEEQKIEQAKKATQANRQRYAWATKGTAP